MGSSYYYTFFWKISITNNFPFNNIEKYIILNNLGQIVLDGEIRNNLEIINLSHLSSGIYVLKVKNNTIKIIKNSPYE